MSVERFGFSSHPEHSSDYSELMLEAISELERQRLRRQDTVVGHCGVVYSTKDPRQAPGLRAAMEGVFDYYSSPAAEGIIPEFKSTEISHQWWYGVDLEWF
ncbi:hypothetical protein KW794_00500 [Candidatus Saccharibacteria bacterium]|nr:hypothetical protein [Candidatus Saccharibacteria bacterium]